MLSFQGLSDLCDLLIWTKVGKILCIVTLVKVLFISPWETHTSQTFTAAHSSKMQNPPLWASMFTKQISLRLASLATLHLPTFESSNEPTPAKCMRCRSLLKNISCSCVLVVEHMSPFWLFAVLDSKQYMSMGSALICRINIPHIIHSIVVQLFYLLWWHSAIVEV
jgi:hypothetical protein